MEPGWVHCSRWPSDIGVPELMAGKGTSGRSALEMVSLGPYALDFWVSELTHSLGGRIHLRT